MVKQREKFYKKSNYKESIEKILLDLKQGKTDEYDSKVIKGSKNEYRLRKGKIRIIYCIHKDRKITIKKIDNRGDVYK